MVLKTIFSETGTNNIVSYPAVDVIEGVSFVKFYGGGLADSGGIKYKLSRDVFFCSTTTTSINQKFTRVITNNEGSFTKKADLDFDSSDLNIPTILYGAMLVNVPVSNRGTGTSDTSAYLVATLRKVAVGGAESDIATATSCTLNSATDVYGLAGGNPNTYFSFNVDVPKTSFRVGEKMRITIELWTKYNSGTNSSWTIAHNPQGEAIAAHTGDESGFGAGYTRMEFSIPFKIDL